MIMSGQVFLLENQNGVNEDQIIHPSRVLIRLETRTQEPDELFIINKKHEKIDEQQQQFHLLTKERLHCTEDDKELPGFTASLRKDIHGVKDIEKRIDYQILSSLLSTLENCKGQIIASGIGKSGLVAQRFASSLSSVGIASQYVQASEWIHGDLGKAQPGRDVVMFISHSGNTEECVTAATHLIARGVTTLALTGGKESKLRKLSVESLCYNGDDVQDTFGCLPTTSIVLQEVLCNALMNELITRKGITREDFKVNHPGGAIGTMK